MNEQINNELLAVCRDLVEIVAGSGYWRNLANENEELGELIKEARAAIAKATQ